MTSKSEQNGDVVELEAANYRIDTAAGPAEEVPPFVVELVDGAETHTFRLPEPDSALAMDLEEAQTSRAFLALAFDDQWPDARPLIEGIRDRTQLMRLAYRYSKHFALDPAMLAEEEDTRNRADRRANRRRGRAVRR